MRRKEKGLVPDTGVIFWSIAISMVKKCCPDGNVQLEIKAVLRTRSRNPE